MLINYKLHYINCTEWSSGCEISNGKAYMQWEGLKEALAQETSKKPKKQKKNKRKSNERNINKKLKLEGKSYKSTKGEEMPAVPPAQFVPCKCKNKCSENFSIESREKMHA